MSSQSKLLRITALLLLALPFMQACQPSLSDATLTAEASRRPQQTVAAFVQLTQAASDQQTRAAFVQLTQTALANQLQQTASPAATPTPQASPTPTETPFVFTESTIPASTSQFSPIAITYGQKLASFPRNQHIIYVFNGARGDSVTILLESSVIGPSRPSCINLPPARTSFILKTPKTQLLATIQSLQFSYIRDYLLPDSGAYSIDVSCSGRLCSCTQADLSLEKK